MTDHEIGVALLVVCGLALAGATIMAEIDSRRRRSLEGYTARTTGQPTYTGQTRSQSAREAVVNILVGYLVNMLANFAIFPLFGWEISLAQNLLIGCFYTVISLVRSYALRRYFNRRHA